MTQNIDIKGSIVALITPMLDDGKVDYDTLKKLIDFHIDNGTHGIVSVGTTGESATLSVDEHCSVIEETVKYVNKRLPVYAGTGANSTQEAIELTQIAEQIGADACLLVVPYYNKPTQEGLYQHFRAIAEAVSIPQILYNVPGRTVLDMQNDTVLRLADIDNIVAIKDATGDLLRGKDLIERCAGKINVLSGDDPTALQHMKLGGKGDISVTANVAPALMSKMCEAALAGDYQKAEELDNKLALLHERLFVESNPIPVKYVAHKMGLTGSELRLPLTKLSAEFHAEVDEAMRSAGII